MYHEVTYEDERRGRRRLAVVALACVVMLALAGWATSASQARARESGARSLREAISSLAMQTYATDGTYPTTLGEIEARYGLVVRDDLYQVSYEWLGDNVPPSVVVMPRG